MSSLTFRKLGFNDAVQFAEGFSEPSATVGYVTIGKVAAWNSDDTATTSVDSDMEIFDVGNTTIGAKKIVGNDVFLVIPRVNWAANTRYSQYDDRTENLHAAANSQYVYTSSGSVYRCIDNANNAVSTDEPSGDYTIDDGFIGTSDNYIWKYLYAITGSNKFLTTSWMPVPTNQNITYYGSANNIIEGAVSRLAIVSGGTGYANTGTTLSIVGNGTGATANATVVGGVVVSTTMLTLGSNYDYQNCSVTVTGNGTSANIRPVLSPPSGHAFNPARELAANTVMVSVRIGDDEATEGGKLTANNDFRQIGLLLAPHKYGDNTEITSANANSFVRMTTSVLLTPGSNFTYDEIIYQGTNLSSSTYRAVVVDYTTNTVEVTEQLGTIRVGVNLTGNTTAVSRTVVSTTPPELKPQSGQLVYVENRAAITRALNQAENIKFVISF